MARTLDVPGVRAQDGAVRRRVLRGLLLVGAVLALSGSASAAESAAPEPAAPAVYPGAEDAGHIGCGEHTLMPVSTADVR